MASRSYDTFDEVKQRLDEIVEAVGDDSLPLDEALALYEEAASLGLRASDLLEENIEAYNAQDEAPSAAEAGGADDAAVDGGAHGDAAAAGGESTGSDADAAAGTR